MLFLSPLSEIRAVIILVPPRSIAKTIDFGTCFFWMTLLTVMHGLCFSTPGTVLIAELCNQNIKGKLTAIFTRLY